MAGAFAALGGFLLIVAAIAIAILLFAAVTGFKKIDKSMLWGIFWAALICGSILLFLGDFVFVQASFGPQGRVMS